MMIATILFVLIIGAHASLRGHTADHRTLLTWPGDAFVASCEIELGDSLPISQGEFTSFLLRYCAGNPGPECKEATFAALPVDIQLLFANGRCPQDPMERLECLLYLDDNGIEFNFAGNLSVLCSLTYPLLKTRGFLGSATKKQYFGTEVLPPDNLEAVAKYEGVKLSPEEELNGGTYTWDADESLNGEESDYQGVKLTQEQESTKEGDMFKGVKLTPEQIQGSSGRGYKHVKLPKGTSMPGDFAYQSGTGERELPTCPPIEAPTKVPVAIPTGSPIKIQTEAPVALSTGSPDQVPSKAPGGPTVDYIGNFTLLEDDDTASEDTLVDDFEDNDDAKSNKSKTKVAKTKKGDTQAPAKEPSISPLQPTASTVSPSISIATTDDSSTPPPSISPENAIIERKRDGPVVDDVVIASSEATEEGSSSSSGSPVGVIVASAAGVIMVAFASGAVQRNKKRKDAAHLIFNDPALRGDSSIASEHSYMPGYSDGGESFATSSKPKHASLFALPSWQQFSKKQKTSETTCNPNRESARLRSPLMTLGRILGQSYSLSRLSKHRESNDATDGYSFSASGTKDTSTTQPIQQFSLTRSGDDGAGVSHGRAHTTSPVGLSDTVAGDYDRQGWRSSIICEPTSMHGETFEGESYFVDESSLINLSPENRPDVLMMPTEQPKVKVVAPLTLKIPFSSIFSGVSWRRNAGKLPEVGKHAPSTPVASVHMPSFQGKSIKRTEDHVAAGEELMNSDVPMESRPWRSRRDRPFSTVFGKKRRNNLSGATTPRTSKTSNRYGKILTAPDASLREAGSIHSVPMDEASLESLGFLSPEIIKQFREVDQRLSDGFKDFKETDRRVSEGFHKLETNLNKEEQKDHEYHTASELARELSASTDKGDGHDCACYEIADSIVTGTPNHNTRTEGMFPNEERINPDAELANSESGKMAKELTSKEAEVDSHVLPPQQPSPPIAKDEQFSDEEDKCEMTTLQSNFASTWSKQEPVREQGLVVEPPGEARLGADFTSFPPSSLLPPHFISPTASTDESLLGDRDDNKGGERSMLVTENHGDATDSEIADSENHQTCKNRRSASTKLPGY